MGKLPNTDHCQDTKSLHLDGFDVNFYFWVSTGINSKSYTSYFPTKV